MSGEQRITPNLIPSFALLSVSSNNKLSRVTTLCFPRLKRKLGLHHGIYTRHGGVSDIPYKSLNTSYKTGDREDNVIQNLEIVKATLGADQLALMNQVHGQDILVLKRDNLSEGDGRISADALVTDVAGLALTVRQADCQGIILFEDRKKVLALVHCGWRGNRDNILQITVERMQRDFGSTPERLRAAIGPSLGPCCAEFVSYKKIFPDDFRSSMVKPNYFNLWEISRRQLKGIGLRDRHIESADICTRCRTDLFYSYRAEEKTGRFATLVMLR